MIDEYQDLNRAEQELFKALARDGEVTAVGDEDQSIYSFKHAHPAGMSDFSVLYPGAADDTLIECRRCPRKVIDAANALIAYNATRQNRVLVPLPTSIDGTIHVLQWPSIEAEAEGIATYIKKRIDDHAVNPGDVLVLSPRRNFGLAVRDVLVGKGISTKSFFAEQELDGNPKLTGDFDAQEAFTCLTLLANPADVVALRAWCGFGDSSLSARGWSSLRQYCDKNNLPVRVALEQIRLGQLTLERCEFVSERFELLAARETTLRGMQGQMLVDQLFPIGQEWAEPIRDLAMPILAADNEIGPVGLLEELQRLITQPEIPVEVDFVRVMSLHKSKGLTAKLVIVLGCMQGLIPSDYNASRTDLSPAEYLEEQRRLFFVAITRTTDTLLLSGVVAVPRGQAHRMGVQARRGRGGRANAVTHTSDFITQLGHSAPTAVSGPAWVAHL